ncbi:MAG: ROK family protein [Deltaproteobacteria bacterium]|nr:ROK family protein [Deltaproteobacteria bacterium]
MNVVVLDIGGTNTRIARVSERLNIEEEIEIKSGKSLEEFMSIVEHIRKIMNEGTKKIGIAVAGAVDYKEKMLKKSPNLPFLNNFSFLKIEENVCIPLFLENDANAAAFGASRRFNLSHIVYITLGTGIGGGVVIDNEILRGYQGYAGEIGHITVVPFGKRCSCGNRGCLEAYTGGWALQREINKKWKNKTVKDLFDLAKENRKARRMVRCFSTFLGIGVASLINIFNPQAIIFGGKMSYSYPYFCDKMKEVVKRRSYLPSNVQFIRDPLPDKAGLLGMAYIALEGKVWKR